jgi:hypothetical protein
MAIGNGAPEYKVIYTESVRATLQDLVQRTKRRARLIAFSPR